MARNIRHVESAFEEAHVKVRRFIRDFEKDFFSPVAETQVASLLGMVPEDILEKFPEVKDIQQRLVKGGRNANNPR